MENKDENLRKKQFRKSHALYMDDHKVLVDLHREWRKWTKDSRKGFFPVFTPDFINKTKDVSGNAIKLYLYLGAHIDNQAGYTIVSVETIAEAFKTTKRSVQNWMKELKKHNLILRIQPGFKQPTYTFLLPYHDEYLSFYPLLKKLIAEYRADDGDTDSELEIDL